MIGRTTDGDAAGPPANRAASRRRWWQAASTVAVLVLFPFGFIAMKACSGGRPTRTIWQVAVVTVAAGMEVAVWRILDPRGSAGNAVDFMLAQAAMLCMAIQLIQGPFLAAMLKGRHRARIALAIPVLAITWVATVPLSRAHRETARQERVASSSRIGAESETGLAGEPSLAKATRTVAGMGGLARMGFDHPAAAESAAGRIGLAQSLADCRDEQAGACRTAAALLADVRRGTMSDGRTITAWLVGLRPMLPAGTD